MPKIICGGKEVELVQNVIVPPTNCPACGGPIEKRKTQKGEGAIHLCVNDECPARGVRKIRKWIETQEIKNLGDSRQQELYDAGIVTKPGDLYRMTDKAVAALFGDGMVKHIMPEIDKTRKLPLYKFMAGLGIPFLGRSNAKRLIGLGVDTLDKFLNLEPNELPGFKKNIKELVDGIQKCIPVIEDLLKADVKIIEPQPEPKEETMNDSPVAGKSYCFTGVRLHGEHKDKFIALGGIEKSGVSKDLDFLVAKDPNGTTGKLKKARDYGVQIISLGALMEALETS